MKITTKLFPGVILLLFFTSFYSCKKETFSTNANSEIEEKVTAWLQSQKSSAKTAKNARTTTTESAKDANVDLLNENLDYGNASTDSLDNLLNLIVIPVKEEVKVKKNLEKTSTVTMFLFTDKTGKIKDGGLIYYIPEDGRQHERFKASDIKNLLLQKKAIKDNGKYRFLSVKGLWFSQIEIKNGKRYSTANVQKKSKNEKTLSQRTTGCTAWYLVTTYYYPDGTTSQTEEFLGITCNGCTNDDYQSVCDEEDSGGGGAGSGGDSGETVGDPIEAQMRLLENTHNLLQLTGRETLQL